MKKTSAIVLASVVGLGVATAAVVPAVATAANSVSAPAADDTDGSSNGLTPPNLGGSGDDDHGRGQGPMGDPSTGMRSALDDLVADGTITAAQADAVVEALVANMPARGDHGPGGHGPGGPGGHGGPGMLFDTVAEVLGMTADEVHQGLEDGKSIADLAKAKGVAVTKVVDALVAEAKAHLAEEVTEGEITQQEADERLAEISTRIEQMVQESGMGGRGMGHQDDAGTGTENGA